MFDIPCMETQGIQHRTCRRCGHSKPITEFHKAKRYEGGRKWWCKTCCNDYNVELRRARQERGELTCDQMHRLKRKVQVLTHYSGGTPKCSCCGEDHIEFLCVDHVHGGGQKHRKELKTKAGHEFYRWLIENNFPEGFRVLCYNCNSALGFLGYCPHHTSPEGRARVRDPKTECVVLLPPRESDNRAA